MAMPCSTGSAYTFPEENDKWPTWRTAITEKLGLAATLVTEFKEIATSTIALFGQVPGTYLFPAHTAAAKTVTVPVVSNPTYPTVPNLPDPVDPGTIDITIDPVTPITRPDFIPLSTISDVVIPPWTLGDLNYHPSIVPTPSSDGSIPTDTTELAPIDPIDVPVPPPWVTPTLTSPDLPVIIDPIIPVWEDVVWPDYFDVDAPVFDNLPPSLNLDPGNMDYNSNINTALGDAIYDGLIHGGTGLAPEVEEAIFQRESERSLLVHNDQMTRIAAEWAKGGFNLPTSMLGSLLMEADNNYVNKRLDTSRDIAIKQAELALTNTHFILNQAQTMEARMLAWFGEIAKRAYEVSRSLLEFGIERYKAEIQAFNALVDIYKTRAQVFEITTAATVKRLEGYRLRLEAAKLTGELNKVNVDVYKAQLDGLMIYINKYRAEMDGAKVHMEIEQLKIQEYKERINAFHVRVQAASAGYGMWNTKVDSEAKQITSYAAGADAWAKRVQGIKVGVDAEAAQVNAEADTNKSLATVFEADIKGYEATVKSRIEEAIAKTKIYEAEISGYLTQVKAMEITKQTQLRIIETQIKAAEEEFTQNLERAKMEFEEVLAEWKLSPQTWDDLNKIRGQIVAAALNAEALTTHLSEGISFSTGTSESTSQSCSEQHYFDDTTV